MRAFRLLPLVAALMQFSSIAHSAVLTQTFAAGAWEYCGVPCRYLEFPITIPPAVASAAIDSVTVTIWGTSRKGSITLCMGADCTTFDCWDGLLASFETTSVGYYCYPNNFHPDGVSDYVAAEYQPRGDEADFVVTRRMKGIELTRCCDPGYTGPVYGEIEASPSFEGVFLGADVALRIQQVNGGMRMYDTCWTCLGGLATIDSVGVAISYEGALDTRSSSWGTMKALFR